MKPRTAIAACIAIGLFPAAVEGQYGDSIRGADVLRDYGCFACHSLRGVGGDTAPDLASPTEDDLSPVAFASRLWNHAPEMWAEMERRGMDVPALSDQQARDVRAFLYAVRYFEPAGDYGRGETVFRQKECYRCHAIVSTDSEGIGPPVAMWPALSDPLRLLEMMWNHGEAMAEDLEAAGRRWPKMTIEDTADLLAYASNLPDLPPRQGRVVFGSAAAGMRVFDDLGCAQCHSTAGGESFDLVPLTPEGEDGHRSLTEMAAAMWNHYPIMREWSQATGEEVAPFEPGQMGHLLSYMMEEGYLESRGDADRGEGLFDGKGCLHCHSEGDSALPMKDYSATDLAAGVWRHGPELRAEMLRGGATWQRISAQEMADIIAFLNQRED